MQKRNNVMLNCMSLSVLLADIGKIHFFRAAAAASRQAFWRWRRLRTLPAVSPTVSCGFQADPTVNDHIHIGAD